jgi:hypothetical protein
VREIDDGGYLMQHMSSHSDEGDSHAMVVQGQGIVRHIVDSVLMPMHDQGLLTASELEDIVDKRRCVWLNASQVRDRLAQGVSAGAQ